MTARVIAFVGLLIALVCGTAAAQVPDVEPWRIELYDNWKALPVPPITPYDGPFGGEPRAFFTKIDKKSRDKQATANWKAYYDWTHTGKSGVYDPEKDPRPINHEFEAAILEDWRRMGYNCAYKGQYFTFYVGEYLKQHGMLGAIDQTLFGQNGPPPLQFDGKPGSKFSASCGSFFDPQNYEAGVAAIAGLGHFYGKDLFTVGDHRLTCSWDEVGMRTRSQMDYRPEAAVEFRKFLKDVWFGDESPDRDSNGDGRSYNAFTGERVASWDEVEPLHVSLNWALPGRGPDGAPMFSPMPEVDANLFDEPGRYKLLVDFHRYFTFEFFRRINDEASHRMNDLGTPGRVSCYPFVQHFIIWPGMNQRNGNSFYWYHRLSPVVNVEHCWPESPAMTLNYSLTDRLAPLHKNAVMGWVWFYFGHEGADMYNGPHDMDRALARIVGHTVDGTHHWLYSPIYRARDQKQRLQIAYWQNFIAEHYAGFLSKSQPLQPQVALLMPDMTGYFYRAYQYPKSDWAYTATALENLQIPYHGITEEELELNPDALNGYKALYVIGSEWSTPTIRRRIEDFLAKGGVVYANVDSLSLDVATGQRTDFLERTFGVRIDHKYKNGFLPSTQSREEAEWALQLSAGNSPLSLQGHEVHLADDPRAWSTLYARTAPKFLLDDKGKPQREENGRAIRDPEYHLIRDAQGKLTRDEVVWKRMDALMQAMPREVRGLSQGPLEMRDPPVVQYGKNGIKAANWGEIDTATVVRGQPIAWWGEKVVGVETDNTIWMGTREGMNVHALFNRMEMHRTTEACNPFPSEVPDSCEARRPYVEAIGKAAEKAGVTRSIAFKRDGRLPLNLEVMPRVDANGTLMVVVVNHDGTDAEYDLELSPAFAIETHEVFDLLAGKTIGRSAAKPLPHRIEPWGVSVLLVGNPQHLAPIAKVQARLAAKDMSVPPYFVDHPELNTNEYNTPIPVPAE